MTIPSNSPLLDTMEPEVVERLSSRREALRAGGRAGIGLWGAIAFGSVPIALAALTRDVYGQAPDTVLQVLEFAFLLENFEAELYMAVLGQSTSAAQNAAFAPVRATLTATEIATLDQIRKHEVAHVAFLRAQITALGGTPAVLGPASFDFTGGAGSGAGPLAAATTDKLVLLAAAQAVEDTGVRAYKGQAGNLISNDAVLTAALRIHSVEARHAARIRRMRAAAGVEVNFSGTITNATSGIGGLDAAGTAVVANVYSGEAGTSHVVSDGSASATLNAAAYASGAGGTDAATEAFDEPLSYAQVVEIVTPFLVAT